ncbi:6329_t:CDS:2 [Funneliformis mosseae]|uniref:6329_t:CDS:1 n=1 Tax=Funneliformis mosseae TaxID=27381 RepID=A0A9N9BKT8_FUNMO|nr:6329_t:CDS:2 [Funneliformis mosseae]
MSLDNIVATLQSLSEEPNKLSEEEEANLYVYLTDKNTKLAYVEKLLNLCKTNNAKLVFLKGLSKKSVSVAQLLSDILLIEYWMAIESIAMYKEDLFVKLPNGVYMLGEPDGPSALFVRNYYHDLATVVLDSTIRIRITVNSYIV